MQLGGVNIMGAPFQAVVLPGRTDARHSTAHGDGLRLSVAGVPASFTIVAADAFGNERSVCGDNFQVHGAPVSRIPNPGSNPTPTPTPDPGVAQWAGARTQPHPRARTGEREG